MRRAKLFVARFVTAGWVVFGMGIPISPEQTRPVRMYENDPRAHALRGFFGELNAPAANYVEDFLAAADIHGLDWRLLPTIAVLESTGGRYHVNNNFFGWDSSRVRFSSPQEGIHFVASRLAKSTIYRHRSLRDKLDIYNPSPGYSQRALWLMSRLQAQAENLRLQAEAGGTAN